MLSQNFCNYRACQRPAYQKQAKYDAKSCCNPSFSFRAMLAWKLGPVKFKRSKYFLDLVHREHL